MYEARPIALAKIVSVDDAKYKVSIFYGPTAIRAFSNKDEAQEAISASCAGQLGEPINPKRGCGITDHRRPAAPSWIPGGKPTQA